MSDVAGASADSVPVADAVAAEPNPISTEPEGQPSPDAKPEGKPEKVEAKAEAKPLTTRQALEKAAATVEKAEAKPEVKTEAKPDAKDAKPEPKAEAKTEAKGPVKDAETGKFVSTKPVEEPKPSYTAGEAPARFTKDVKDAWATLPDNVRGEVSRMERELTQGYEKHKVAAERDATLNEFHDMAKQSGKDLPTVVREYVNMEQTLRKDLVGGLDTICQRLGVSLRDVAAHVMGQKPEEVAGKQDATIRELRGQIENLTKQVGTVSQTFQQQQETAVGKEVTAFAADHPRFGELADDIAFFLKSRCPGDLKQAYELAERLNPAPASAKTEVAKTPVIDLSAQTEKGQKSINGAPSPGSSPAASKPSNSIRDALKKAVAAAG